MYYIGIDLGGTNIAVGLVDENGTILQQAEKPTALPRSAKEICEDMAHLALEVIKKQGITVSDVKALGCGVPGITNSETGNVVFCTNLGWHDVPLREYMKPIIDVPVFIENDATVAGLAESVAGVAKGYQTAVLLTLGTGVGGGLVIDGKVFSGAHHVGSELGHIIVHAGGEQCTCGNKGCLERYASATALARMGNDAMKKYPKGALWQKTGGDPSRMTAKKVVDSAKEGDAGALEAFGTYTDYLAYGLVSVVNFLDPQIIILGGGLSRAGEFLRSAVEEKLAQLVFYKDVGYAKVCLASLGNEAGIIGAAMLGK